MIGATNRRWLFAAIFFAAGLASGQQQGLDLATAKRLAQYDRTIDLLLDEDQLSPASLEVTEGRYRILVHNAFTSTRLDVQVDDEDKKVRVSDQEVKEKASRSEFLVDLKPGKYKVVVAQRRKWQCLITVVGKKGN